MGSKGYRLAGQLAYRPGQCILEIGSERGEGSTAQLAGFAAAAGVPFYTIDPDSRAHAAAAVAAHNVQAILGRAEDVLTSWDGPAPGFTWADGYDWPYSWCAGTDWFSEQVATYAARGESITEQASQTSHLVIAGHIDRLAQAGAVIAFDDTWRRDGVWTGKGGQAIRFLLGTGRWVVNEAQLPGCVDEQEPVKSFAVLACEVAFDPEPRRLRRRLLPARPGRVLV